MLNIVRITFITTIVLCCAVIIDAAPGSPVLELTILGSGGPRADGRAASATSSALMVSPAF